jgi:hypothetical protein
MPDTIDVVPNVVSGIAVRVLGVAQDPLTAALDRLKYSAPNSVATGDRTCDIAYAEMLAAGLLEAEELRELVTALGERLSEAAHVYRTVERANTARLRPRGQ